MRPVSVVTGGQGFLGRHVVQALLARDHHVISVDLPSNHRTANGRSDTGRAIPPATGRLTCMSLDLTRLDWALGELAEQATSWWHLASPAAPKEYKLRPIDTLRVNLFGLDQILDHCKEGTRVIYASSSEVYGAYDASKYPEGVPETEPGVVSSVGPRSCYDEAKRAGEALCVAHHHQRGTDVRIARIFNTYGPGCVDTRLVPSLMRCALTGEQFVAHGGGHQNRTLCYVDDLIVQLMALHDMPANLNSPMLMNVGGIDQVTVLELAEMVRDLPGACPFPISTDAPPQDVHDPAARKPDLSRMKDLFALYFFTPLKVGLLKTFVWWRQNERELRRA